MPIEMPIVMTEDGQYGLRPERISCFRFTTTVEGRVLLHALVGQLTVLVGEFPRRAAAERAARLLIGEPLDEPEGEMNHDATLGIRLTDLCRAQEQSPVRVNPETWARYPAIAGLGAIPQEIRRTDLAERAGRISWDAPHHDEVARLFVLTMAWGSGVTNGRGPRYTGAALAAGASTIDTLVHTRALIAEGDVAGAYRLHRRLPGVGPSFHTKWMWVVGTTTPLTGPRPLILDSLVWQSLGADGIHWDSVMAAGGSRDWGDRYVAYLHAAEAWADAASIGTDGGRYTAEDVEFTLFEWAREGSRPTFTTAG
ncbi:MAG: hypothetical protein H6513_17375 [Acidimicrobiaceae bacterium]|nr:hypothetical protein [Ilumatobacter sp.]MCB9382459.1 hypothetical protein [Acidimicrobiaceae bacterium]MCO5329767.1 hypothetical protein [Ilumatobacteraceae bacterium]